MVLLETRLEALEDLDGFNDRRLDDIHLLEAPREGVVFLEDLPELGVGGGADALQLPGRQGGLEQVGRIQRTAGCRAGPDERVDLVDEKYGVLVFGELLEHGLEALLEVAPIFGAGQERAHVEGVDLSVGEDVGYPAFDDAPRQAFGDGGLANAGFTDQQRIVLAAPAERLDDPLDLFFAADQRVDLAKHGLLVEVLRVVVERAAGAAGFLFLLALLGFARRALRSGARLRRFGDAVGNEVHHVEARNVLPLEEIDGVGILLAEDRDQHIGAGDFFLAGRLDVQDRALNHPLEAQGGLGVDVFGAFDLGRVFIYEVGQFLAQLVGLCGASPQNLCSRGIVQERKQKMLHGNELMAFLSGLDKSHVQTDFKLLRDHFSFPP